MRRDRFSRTCSKELLLFSSLPLYSLYTYAIPHNNPFLSLPHTCSRVASSILLSHSVCSLHYHPLVSIRDILALPDPIHSRSPSLDSSIMHVSKVLMSRASAYAHTTLYFRNKSTHIQTDKYGSFNITTITRDDGNIYLTNSKYLGIRIKVSDNKVECGNGKIFNGVS